MEKYLLIKTWRCSETGRVLKYKRSNTKWDASWQNQQNDLCAQRRLRSAWASVQSGQSRLCAQWATKESSFLHVDSQDWSDWANAQAALSLCWAHKPFYWFCHEAAQIVDEKSRKCHNHRSQQTPGTDRKSRRTSPLIERTREKNK